MAKKDPLSSQLLNSLRGALMFAIIVAGGTYYLQSSLVVFKHFGSHAHWTTVLVALPFVAGLLVRLLRVCFPLLSVVSGVAISVAILYPSYKGFWANPPGGLVVAIYSAIILGLGFIATQPLRTTFMAAFHIGKFAVPPLPSRASATPRKTAPRSVSQGKGTSTGKKSSLSKTQRLQSSDHGQTIAMLELLVGVTSLLLSIFSVFFMGRG